MPAERSARARLAGSGYARWVSDDDRDRIVADYLAGQDVADIERRYDVTRAEIEWLVSRRARAAGARPDPAVPGRPPAPVVAAVALLAGWALLQAAVIVVLLVASAEAWAVLLLLVPAIPASIAYGAWHGWRGSQIGSVVIGLLLVLAGLQSSDRFGLGPVLAGVGAAVAVLVVAPGSARAWFGWPTRSGSPRRRPDR